MSQKTRSILLQVLLAAGMISVGVALAFFGVRPNCGCGGGVQEVPAPAASDAAPSR